jgi:hypothetical protein
MNERIKELAKKAGAETWSRPPFRAVTGVAFTDEALQKFAELIAKECADICLEMAAKCGGILGDGALAKDCAYWIKKDFGVEE